MRLRFIDLLKGFTIFLVVFSHILQHYYSDSAYLVRLISSFFMPLFMFMSGYVCFRKNDWILVKKRAVQLLVPFFSYIPISYLFYEFTKGTYGSFIEYFSNIIIYPDRGLWFLWALFFISVLHITSIKIAEIFRNSKYIIYVFVAIVLNSCVYIFNYRFFGFHWIAWYFIYYIVGIAWREYDQEVNYRINYYKRYLPIITIAFLLMSVFFRMHNEAPIFYKWINLGSLFIVFYRLLIGIMGIATCMCIFRVYESKLNNLRMLTKWGDLSLGIYYLHFLVISLLFGIQIPATNLRMIVLVIIYGLFTTWLCGKIAELSLRYRISSLLIMGR